VNVQIGGQSVVGDKRKKTPAGEGTLIKMRVRRANLKVWAVLEGEDLRGGNRRVGGLCAMLRRRDSCHTLPLAERPKGNVDRKKSWEPQP